MGLGIFNGIIFYKDFAPNGAAPKVGCNVTLLLRNHGASVAQLDSFAVIKRTIHRMLCRR